MAPIMNNPSEKPCEVCGSVSRVHTMKTCSRCDAQEHAYCSRTLNFNLSEDWLCEACQPNHLELPFSCLEELSMASPLRHENSKTRISFHAPGTAPHDEMIFANKTGVHNDLPGQNACQRRYISSPRKIKVILPDEVKELESRKRQEAKMRFAVPLLSHKSRSTGQSSQFTKSTPQSLPLMAKVDPRERPLGLHLTPRSGCPRSSFRHNSKGTVTLTENKGLKCMDRAQSQPTNEAQVYHSKMGNSAKRALGIYVPKRKRAFRTLPESQVPANEQVPSQQLKKHNGEEQQKKPLLATETKFSGPDMEKAWRWASSVPSLSKYSPDIKSGWPPIGVEEQWDSLDYVAVLKILPDLCRCIPYFPALSAIWKGQFILPGIACFGEHHGVFRACPPSRVHRKLYELLKHMPENLQLELVHRCKVWSELFQDGCPNLLDVGVYFYPADLIDRSILNSYHLLELMESQDFLLRCHLNGAELFISTSKQLQVDPQILRIGLKNKYFLWGVFRKLKSLPHLDISTMEQSVDGLANGYNNNVIDMDVDMVGGIEVDLLRKSSAGAQGSCKDTAYGGKTSQHAEPLKNCQEQAVDMVRDPTAACSELLLLEIASGKESSSMEKHEKFIRSEEKKWASLHNEISLHRNESSGRLSSPSSQQPIEVSTQAQNCWSNDPYSIKKSPNLPCKVDMPKNFSSLSSSVVAVPKGNLGPAGIKVKAEDFALEKAESIAVSMCNQASVKVKVEAQDSSSGKEDYTGESPKLAFTLGMQNGCSPELVNFVKLKTCSVSKGNQGPSGAGGTVRDSSGKWIFGYVRNLGDCNSLRAEMWALFEGLKLVWDKGFRRVLVECESYPACESLKKAPSMDDPNRAILQGCRNLLLRDWICHIKHLSKGSIQASCLVNRFENLDTGKLIIF